METITINLRILDRRTSGRCFNSIELFCGYPVTVWRPGQDFTLVLDCPRKKPN